jgi:hypothetical protein
MTCYFVFLLSFEEMQCKNSPKLLCFSWEEEGKKNGVGMNA